MKRPARGRFSSTNRLVVALGRGARVGPTHHRDARRRDFLARARDHHHAHARRRARARGPRSAASRARDAPRTDPRPCCRRSAPASHRVARYCRKRCSASVALWKMWMRVPPGSAGRASSARASAGPSPRRSARVRAEAAARPAAPRSTGVASSTGSGRSPSTRLAHESSSANSLALGRVVLSAPRSRSRRAAARPRARGSRARADSAIGCPCGPAPLQGRIVERLEGELGLGPLEDAQDRLHRRFPERRLDHVGRATRARAPRASGSARARGRRARARRARCCRCAAPATPRRPAPSKSPAPLSCETWRPAAAAQGRLRSDRFPARLMRGVQSSAPVSGRSSRLPIGSARAATLRPLRNWQRFAVDVDPRDVHLDAPAVRTRHHLGERRHERPLLARAAGQHQVEARPRSGSRPARGPGRAGAESRPRRSRSSPDTPAAPRGSSSSGASPRRCASRAAPVGRRAPPPSPRPPAGCARARAADRRAAAPPRRAGR